MAAMALLGFAGSHGGGHHSHDTGGHDMHGHAISSSHGHSSMPSDGHSVAPPHGHPIATTHGHAHAPGSSHTHDVHPDGWKSSVFSWLSPRVLFNFLVGFGATGLIVERLVGPVLALPIAALGGIGFEVFVVRPLFNSLFRFESQPAQTLESALMSEGRAVTGFDANGNGLIALELGGEVVQVLGTQLKDERQSGVRIRAGDIVRIEGVDDSRNRCTVSRIGLGEIESGDTDRN